MRRAEKEPLTLQHLSDEILSRSEESFHALEDWSPAELACCVAGEVGEACNLIKKIRRFEDGEDRPYNKDFNYAALVDDIGKELADNIIYTVILAARLEIDLEAAVISKFNEVSERVKSPRRL